MKNHNSLNEEHIYLALPRKRVTEESTITEKFSIRNTASPSCAYTGLKCIAKLCCIRLGSKFPPLEEPVNGPGARAQGSVNQDIHWGLDLTFGVAES